MATLVRKNMIDYIKNNIRVMGDAEIEKIYNLAHDTLKTQNDENMTRRDKIIYVENNLEFIDEHGISDIKKLIIVALICNETQGEKMNRIGLEIINKILVSIEKPEITDVSNFSKISRKSLKSELCKNIINENMNYIFENGFNKVEFAPYLKSLKSPQIAFLRAMLKQIGYEMQGKNRTVYSGDTKHTETFYFLQKCESLSKHTRYRVDIQNI